MSDASCKISHTGSWVSVLLGGITGLIGTAVCFFGVILITELITDDTLAAIAIFALYSHPTVGVCIALLPTLWFSGRYAEARLLRGDKLLTASFKYCLLTNLIVWGVFSLLFIFGPLGFGPGLTIPLVLFFSFLIFSTFTIGLWVCSIIKRRLRKKQPSAYPSL